ncbi:MAG TPA: hypothetical protein VFD23_03835, partial [Clostridia bacterium]|nr:hypothetical protein [Clostridia bacterium]
MITTMKHLAKKSISLLLALSLVFGVMATGTIASAAAVTQDAALSETTQAQASLTGSSNPIVIVPGIGMSDVALFDDEGNQIANDGTFTDQWRVLNLSTTALMDDIFKLIPKVLLSLILQRDVGLSDVIRDYLPGMFKYATHDLEGKSVENVRAIERNYPLSQYDTNARDSFFSMMPMENFVDQIGEDRIYSFNFPAFSNTYDQAEKLDQFIQIVKGQTGAEKVNLVPVSLGATITNAYFDNYAHKHDVAKVVRIVGASDGSYVFSDLISQNYSVNSEKLFYSDLMPQLADGYQGYLINLLLRILPKKVFNNVLDAAFDVLRNDFVVNTPSMWSIVPADKYEELADIHLSGPEYATLRAQTDKYYAYQSNLQQNVYDLIEDGVEVYNICGYGFNIGKGWTDYQYFQFFKCADDMNSDGVIQIASTGMGTHSAAPGTTLPDGYVQQNTNCTNPAHNHISPDRVIDASTSFLPDQTWYFSGQHHECAHNDVVIKLAVTLMSSDAITSVYSDPDFPQFNGSRFTRRILRDYLPLCIEAQSRTDLTAPQMMELNAAVDQCNAMLASTVADDEQTVAIEARLKNILVRIGAIEAPVKATTADVLFEKSLKLVSDGLWKKYGPRGYSEIATLNIERAADVLKKLIGLLPA